MPRSSIDFAIHLGAEDASIAVFDAGRTLVIRAPENFGETVPMAVFIE